VDDPRRLESYGLAVGDVVQTLAAQNVEIPGGRLTWARASCPVKTRARCTRRASWRTSSSPRRVARPVRIGDVARVEDGAEERRSTPPSTALRPSPCWCASSRLEHGRVAHRVKALVEKLRDQLPKGVTIAIPIDNSTFIENMIHDVSFDLVYGALLAILIIMFFLHDWRATLISAPPCRSRVIATSPLSRPWASPST